MQNKRPRVDMKRTTLDGMRENDVIERYRLSPDRIRWLVERFGNILERDTDRNFPLSAETQVSGLKLKIIIIIKSRSASYKYI